MNGNLKRYIYIIGAVFVMFFVVSIFFRILPWLLLVGLISYIITKIVKFIKEKSEKKDSSKSDTSYSIPSDEYINGEVIDVEYEDVDNKKD